MEVLERELSLQYELGDQDPRAHIGIVLLSTDHSLEMEWRKILSDKALLFVNRLPFSGDLHPESLGSIEKEIQEAAQYIATGLQLDVLAFACTSSSMVLGSSKVASLLNYHHRLPIPVTNPALAACEALNALGAKRIAIFSPYPMSTNQFMIEDFSSNGFEIETVGALYIDNDTIVAKVTRESILDGIDKIMKKCQPDALFLSCTNLRVFDLIEEIEQMYSIPVVTSNQALYWHALHLLDQKPAIEGYGRLLSTV